VKWLIKHTDFQSAKSVTANTPVRDAASQPDDSFHTNMNEDDWPMLAKLPRPDAQL
jgi:hypothetical protein